MNLSCDRCQKASEENRDKVPRLTDLATLLSIADERKQELSDLITQVQQPTYDEQLLKLKIEHSRLEMIHKSNATANLKIFEDTLVLSKWSERLHELRRRRETLETSVEAQQVVKLSLRDHLSSLNHCLKVLRLRAAIQLFSMIKLEVPFLEGLSVDTLEEFVSSSMTANSSGFATVQGMPFLAQGCPKELSLLLPSELVSTVCGFVCHLLDCLSAVLNIPLLHTVFPFEAYDAIVTSVGDQTNSYPLCPVLRHGYNHGHGRHSTGQWDSIVDAYRRYQQQQQLQAAHRVINYGKSKAISATGTRAGVRERPATTPSGAARRTVYTPSEPLAAGRYYAGATPNHSRSSSVPSSSVGAGGAINRSFHKALQLLQASVVNFAQKIGLTPEQLFESSAFLPNMYLISIRCQWLLKQTTEPDSQGPVDSISSYSRTLDASESLNSVVNVNRFIERHTQLAGSLLANQLMRQILRDLSTASPDATVSDALRRRYCTQRTRILVAAIDTATHGTPHFSATNIICSELK